MIGLGSSIDSGPRTYPAPSARTRRSLDLVIIGLSITSSWGNGHATNYRALVRALSARGHRVLFLEWDAPWYACNRDLKRPVGGELRLYGSVDELQERYWERVRMADAVIVGSFVRDGVDAGHWVNDVAEGTTVFYDIDTPITLGKLEAGDFEYIEPSLVRRYDLYLSFTGGPFLRALESRYGSAAARPFYCMVDADEYRPARADARWELGYLGTYSADRQPGLERMLVEPARLLPELRMCVAGPGYPSEVCWPDNVERIEHVAPPEHPSFYNRQLFTLNVTRDLMARAGWSPSVRLFEAAACGVPIVSDAWEGLDNFFYPGHEIFVVESVEDVVRTLRDTPRSEAREVGHRARQRVLAWHTAEHRARELEQHLRESRTRRRADDRPTCGPSVAALRPAPAEIPYLGSSFR